MEALIQEGTLLINAILQFPDDTIYLGLPIVDDRLHVFENEIGYLLPLDFKCMMLLHNGISLLGTNIYGLDSSLKVSSLKEVYLFEHSEGSMPKEFLPFSPDGRGNHYCLNLSGIKNGLCPVMFWQWDFQYNTMDDIEQSHDNFFDWVKEVMIDWNSDNENYTK